MSQVEGSSWAPSYLLAYACDYWIFGHYFCLKWKLKVDRFYLIFCFASSKLSDTK